MMSLLNTLLGATLISLAALPASSNYQLHNYGLNSGGSNSTSSNTFRANVGAGEIGGAASGATTYKVKSGSIEAQQANVPGAPTLDNGSNTYYNKLKFILNTSGNPSDTTFAIAVATDSGFASTSYVQSNGTLSSSPVWQTYSQWGGASGSFAVGLDSSRQYWFKAAAMQGQFTQSAYGPSATASTVSPALSFSVSPTTVNMGSLNAGNIFTNNLSFTFTTNAVFGGIIYMSGSNTGLASASVGHTLKVNPPSGDLTSLSEGFGLQGVSASSPLAIQTPFNGSGNTVGAVLTSFQPVFSSASSVNSGTASAALKSKAAVSTPAAKDYTVTLTFVAAANY